MKVQVTIISNLNDERVEIYTQEVTPAIKELIQVARNQERTITCYNEDKIYQIAPSRILYIEVVDKKIFVYTNDDIYQSRDRLYQMEESLDDSFLRISKSMLLNVNRIDMIRPTISGRFEARLQNDERVTISRKYVPELKKRLGMN